MNYKEFNWIIFLDGSAYKDMFIQMFADFERENNVYYVIDNPKNIKFKRALANPRIRKYIKNKLDFFSYEKNNLYWKLKEISDKKETVVVFTNSGLGYNPYFPDTLLRYKKEMPNIRYVALYLDIFKGNMKNVTNLLYLNHIFESTYTIEKEDAIEFGMIHVMTPYSFQKKFSNIPTVRDIYFCGASKGRNKILACLADECKKNQVNAYMEVVCYEDDAELRKNPEIIKVKGPGEYEKYSSILKKELEANCILDIVQEGQEALTLRPYEAVIYNKKILTNNKAIKKFPFYNPNYIHVIEDFRDIDWTWVQRRENVNYEYKGEFSPIKLLELIANDIENR